MNNFLEVRRIYVESAGFEIHEVYKPLQIVPELGKKHKPQEKLLTL